MSKILFLLFVSLLYLIFLVLFGYIRLYLMSKIKIRNIIIIQSVLFIIGEIILGIYFFVYN